MTYHKLLTEYKIENIFTFSAWKGIFGIKIHFLPEYLKWTLGLWKSTRTTILMYETKRTPISFLTTDNKKIRRESTRGDKRSFTDLR